MSAPVGFTLVQLRYFTVAAETGSMTAAAEELLIAQSAVSTAVSNLERELDVQLFIRRRAKGLTLTAAGERLLRQARKLLAHAQEVAEEAQGGERPLSGPVSLGCFVTLVPFHLPGLLDEFATRHPGVDAGVVEAEAIELAAALRAGRIEFALSYDLGYGDDVVRERIASVPAYAIVAADHPLAARTSVDLTELAQEPFVLLDLPHSRDYFWSLVTATGATPRLRHRSQSYEAVRSLVARGHGFSLLHQRPATTETYGGGEVVALSLTTPHPPLDLVIARLADVRQTARARALMEVVREVVPENLAGATPEAVTGPA